MSPALGDGCWQRVLVGWEEAWKTESATGGNTGHGWDTEMLLPGPHGRAPPSLTADKTETRADQGQGLQVGRGTPSASTHEPHLTTHSASSADHTRLGMAGKARPW